MEILIVLAGLAAVVWWLGRRELRKEQATGTTVERAGRERPGTRIAAPATSPPRRPAPSPPPVARAARHDAAWVPLGTSVSVQGLALPGGVYVGQGLEPVSRYGGREPALIDPTLPVNVRQPDTQGRQMNYWPSYSEIPPASRGAYLQWLAAGRPGGAYIGYVFLFFYGIERRVILDSVSSETARREVPALLAEVERLLELYGDNGSFGGYAGDFLATARLTGGARDVADMTPPRERTGWDVPLEVRLVAGTLSAAGEPLPADWALAWALNTPEIPLRTPATRCPEELAQVFAVRYRQAYGDGLVIKPTKGKLQMEYRPASSSFAGHRVTVDTGGVPDVTRLSGPTKKLAALVAAATEDLDGYSRCVGRQPDPAAARARARAALVTLRERMPEDRPVVLPSEDVAKVVDAHGKVTKSASAAARALLGAHGLAVEPAEFGKGALSVLWRDADAAAAPGDGFGAATVLLHLGVTVSASDGEVSAAEEQHLEAGLESAFDLPAAGRRRLRAHLRWLLAERPGIAGVKARVGALGSAERELIARYLLAVAGADGQVSPREIDTLRKLYGMLGLDPEAVHRDIHGLAAPSAPVPVIAPDADQGDVPVPGETLLDKHRLADVLSSTDRVAEVLGAVFDGEAQAAAADEPEEPKEEENDGEATVAGLDLHHTALVQRLAARADWPREDFDAVAGEQGLLPAGAIETINDAAFEVTGAPLLEGDDPVELDGDVLKELLDA
jgi:uncharacterized tellurite resistance protein B-like protein